MKATVGTAVLGVLGLLGAAGAPAVAQVQSRLSRFLAPYTVATAFDQYWDLLLAGKDSEAKKVIADLGGTGIAIP